MKHESTHKNIQRIQPVPVLLTLLLAATLSMPQVRAADEPAAQGAGGADSTAARGEHADAADILDRYVAVTGGKKAYKSIKNRVVRGTLELVAQGIKGDVTIYAARPNLLYSLIEAEALGKIERGTDGQVVWESSMMTGPVIKEGQEKLDMLRDATFDRQVAWRETFKGASTVGVETVDGKTCDKIEMTPEAGHPQYWYYERESGLLVRLDAKIETQMGAIDMESYMKDYQATDNILMPRELRINVLGQERRLTTTSVEHNVDLPADRFTLPEGVRALVKQQAAESASGGTN